ncbi:hypothetical protein GW17_00000887 [Ensete ventricosum]|nr:hypothetical protein GW17_00000887 [Ensete ventricosum]
MGPGSVPTIYRYIGTDRGKASYRAVYTGPPVDWYSKRPLLGGTVEIGQEEEKHTFTSSPRHPLPAGEEMPVGDFFSSGRRFVSSRGEKDRGDRMWVFDHILYS